MNQKGATLLELIIYIVLFAIVSLVVGKQFKSLMNIYSTGKRIVRQQTDTRDILGQMVRKIRNTGVKIYFRSSGSDLVKDTASGTFISASDLSSFRHSESEAGTYGDTLTVYMARLTGSGDSAGVDTVTYYLDGTTLIRKIQGTGGNYTSTVAKNVFALQFEYGIYGIDSVLFKDSTTNYANWLLHNESGTTPTKATSSPLTLTFTGPAKGYVKYITPKSVVMNRKYSVLLDIETSGGFPDALDSLRFEFVSGTSLCGFEKFKPASGMQRIIVRDSISGMATSMRLRYGANDAGILKVKAVAATCIEDSAFTWVNRFTGTSPDSTAYKENVRAIRIHLLTRTSDRAGTDISTNIQVANVSVPRSGQYTWRYYRELVEIPNNGRF